MAMEIEPNFADEKNDFLNRQDMAIGCIFWSMSPKILHQVYDESQDSTPNEIWTKLEVRFGNKEDCEDYMQETDKIEPTKNPLEEKASQFEETSIHVSTHPFVQDDVYSISDLFSESHVEDIMHASQDPHAETPMHAY
jgi:hypothetical protein